MSSISEVNRRLVDNAEELCLALLPQGRRDGRQWLAGDVRGGAGQSLRVELAGPKAGLWKDFAGTDKGADLVDLVAQVYRMNLTEAKRWAEAWLAGHPPPVPYSKPESLPRERDSRMAAERLWRRCADIGGTVAERYLRNRGITCKLGQALGFAYLKHRTADRVMPAMVAAIRDIRGDLIGVHRTFLTPDGRKGDVEPNKMALGHTAGGAVRLVRHTSCLGLAEGIETALSAYQLTGIPVWSLVGTSGFGNVLLPEAVRHVVLFADGDKPGLRDAEVARERFVAEGREVLMSPAPAGMDWNDVLLGRSRGTLP
jgi:hypothetical protein